MKTLIYGTLITSGLLFIGCSQVTSPAIGSFYTGTKSAIMATGETIDESKKKVGEAECIVILGFATGDCSIETAAKSAGIKKVHYVDGESLNVLGIFGKYKVIVTGE
ncbi:hypothetical protein BBW65_07080 [Helicobacter enhydrae]|uniref:TRL-like family protein n=1 Tax=Helicobacter enhydrae TaxID=222136 RepID=A0A1B1U763_9HELI|nr:TRL domain-containing protein [Helicobacter enhydrae]ANV98301.1 hypothetical protein BBW65_05585 [Helicobacter enhydrae]ANV98571.1 hypothetical protein BBW65_07080 [Helicobacter enhydrae]